MKSKHATVFLSSMRRGIIMHVFFTLLSISITLPAESAEPNPRKILRDDFSKGLSQWIVEDAAATDPAAKATFSFRKDTAEIRAPKGLTLWFNHKLQGDYTVSYDVLFLVDPSKDERLSDLNCFWNASDPRHPDSLFFDSAWRQGVFSRYNSLNLYYVGHGGNDNSTTRFRKYYGYLYDREAQKGDAARIKPLIQGYTQPEYLLQEGRWDHIEIRVRGNRSEYRYNGRTLFRYDDKENPYTEGYFGLRLLRNRILLTNFRIDLY